MVESGCCRASQALKAVVLIAKLLTIKIAEPIENYFAFSVPLDRKSAVESFSNVS